MRAARVRFPGKARHLFGHPLRQKWVPEWIEKEIVSMLSHVHRKLAGQLPLRGRERY